MLLSPILAALGAQLAFAGPILNPRATSVTVNVGTTYQTMDGFGFSQAFGRANDLYNLPSTQRSYALDLLFSTTAGAGFSILRVRIGSGGAGDSIEPTAPASPTTTPAYAWDGNDTNQVWVAQQARTYGVSTFYADAWSAPGFMKTNDDQDNGGYLCGVTGETCSSGSWLQAYANFLVQYIKDYASVGISITDVGFLNEPELTTTYSSMLSDGQQAADFIKVLYPTLQSAGLGSVGITCCDAEGWNDQKTFTADLITAGVQGMLSRITSHAYTSVPNTPISTTLRVWQTEYTDLSGAWSTTWYSSGALGEGLTWANLLHTGIVSANLSAYLNWEGIENSTSNSGLIQISGTPSAAVVTPSSRLWAYAHFSRHVRPGSVRVGTTGAPTSCLISAFKNTDGSVSVHVINNGASDQAISLGSTGWTTTGVAAWVTNQANLGVVSWTSSLSGGIVTGTVPAYSIVTFVLSGSGSTGSSSTTSSSTSKATTSTSTTSKSTTSTTTSKASTTSTSASQTTTGCVSAKWGQCAGMGWTGCTSCISGTTCTYSNAWYSQCL